MLFQTLSHSGGVRFPDNGGPIARRKISRRREQVCNISSIATATGLATLHIIIIIANIKLQCAWLTEHGFLLKWRFIIAPLSGRAARRAPDTFCPGNLEENHTRLYNVTIYMSKHEKTDTTHDRKPWEHSASNAMLDALNSMVRELSFIGRIK